MRDCAYILDASINHLEYLLHAGLNFGRDPVPQRSDIHRDGTKILAHAVMKFPSDPPSFLILHLNHPLAELTQDTFRASSFCDLALQLGVGFTKLRRTIPHALLQGVVRFA